MRKFRLTIQEFTPASDLEGVPASWADVATAFGEVTPLTGREYLQAQQVASSVSHRIRTEYVAGCNPRMRLVNGEGDLEGQYARIWNVASVVNVGESNRSLEWMCTEVV